MSRPTPITNRLDQVMLGAHYNSSSDAVANGTTTINNTGDDYDHRWSFEFSVIISTILSISAFSTIVGNGMVLMVIVRHREMRTRTNLFLVNLAVTDLLVGVLVVPFSIVTLMENRWVFGEGFVCMFNGWMNSFCLITSFHTLMYISIHKYFSIVRPLDNPLTLNYILAMLAASWIWAAICSTMIITGLTVQYKPGTSQCGPRYPHDVPTFIIHGFLMSTVIIVPAGILVFCYFRMYLEIRKHTERLRNNSTLKEDCILSQEKKVTVTLFIVLATFVMMALPYHVYATYTTVKKDKQHFSSYINPLAYMCLYLSSMCNPIIYAFRYPAFKEGYKEILCQTPKPVLYDETELCARSRLPSNASNPRTHRDSDIDPDHRMLTSEPPIRKKISLPNLLKSTGQSNDASVVHLNGDIIIVKGGKIVSYRPRNQVNDGNTQDTTLALQVSSTVEPDRAGRYDGLGGIVSSDHYRSENGERVQPPLSVSESSDIFPEDGLQSPNTAQRQEFAFAYGSLTFNNKENGGPGYSVDNDSDVFNPPHEPEDTCLCGQMAPGPDKVITCNSENTQVVRADVYSQRGDSLEL